MDVWLPYRQVSVFSPSLTNVIGWNFDFRNRSSGTANWNLRLAAKQEVGFYLNKSWTYWQVIFSFLAFSLLLAVIFIISFSCQLVKILVVVVFSRFILFQYIFHSKNKCYFNTYRVKFNSVSDNILSHSKIVLNLLLTYFYSKLC